MSVRFLAALAMLAAALSPRAILAADAADPAPPFPVQLDMRVPFAPTAFSSGGHTYLLYELRLTNFGGPLVVSRIDVRDADGEGGAPLASFAEGQLDPLMQAVAGAQGARASRRQIAAGATATVFLQVELGRGARLPERLIHHVVLAGGAVDGAATVTHGTQLRTLGAPLQGSGWLASDGPGNSEDNHHRRGLIVVGGRALISRRYAIDWMQMRDAKSFAGDPRDRQSYYAYGKPVLAVADARVVAVTDGLPENVPGHNEDFHPAIALTLQNVIGNRVILDLGGGQYVYYCHLQPGSLRVKAGDVVRRGQILAKVGASGDAREPHLHLEVTNAPQPLAGEGVPYAIDRYRVGTDKGTETERNALPMDKMVVDFP